LSGDLLAAIRGPKKLKKASERKMPPPKESGAAAPSAPGKPGLGGGMGAMGGMLNIAAMAAKRAQAMAVKRPGGPGK
jgi:hypothetical protein